MTITDAHILLFGGVPDPYRGVWVRRSSKNPKPSISSYSKAPKDNIKAAKFAPPRQASKDWVGPDFYATAKASHHTRDDSIKYDEDDAVSVADSFTSLLSTKKQKAPLKAENTRPSKSKRASDHSPRHSSRVPPAAPMPPSAVRGMPSSSRAPSRAASVRSRHGGDAKGRSRAESVLSQGSRGGSRGQREADIEEMMRQMGGHRV